MDILFTLALVCLAAVVFCTYRSSRRPNNFPPGPSWLPFFGNSFYIRKLCRQEKYLHKVFELISRHFNSQIIGLKFGRDFTVVVSGSDLVREVLTRKEFDGRPDTFFIRLRSMGTKRGITFTDGYLWQDQRAFVLRHLRNLGYGKDNMEDMLQLEFTQLKRTIDSLNGEKTKMGRLLAPAVLNVLWTLIGGARLPSDKFYLEKILVLFDKRSRIFDMSGGLLSHFPFLRFIAPNGTGYKVIVELNRELKSLFQEVIAEHESSIKPNHTRDLIDAFLHQKEKETDPNRKAIYTEDQLIMICLDLFIAGAQTTSNTLDFALLFMILYPDVQKKVREEIWSVIGKEHPPKSKDRSMFPYVEAVLLESSRLCHVTPIGGPRRTLKATTLHGYTIPKDSSIFINNYSVNMNKHYWKDPETFMPERFLNNDGTLKNEDELIIFGLGRRRCLGEALARSFIFTFFTSLLQHYQIHQVPGDRVNIIPMPGITLSPAPYFCFLTPAEETK